MGNWILGLVIFWGLVFIISCFSHRQNNSLTDKDYEKMKRKWAEQDEKEKMLDDYIEAEIFLIEEKLSDESTDAGGERVQA